MLDNKDKWPLTDLYLVIPVLKSTECTPQFRQLILDFIEGKSRQEICELVNGATSTVLAYLAAGGKTNSRLVFDIIKWIKAQRLKDGGWHWKPLKTLSTDVRGEAWITAAVFAVLRKVDDADKNYMDSILEFLKRDWETRKWESNPEVTLVYLGMAGLNKNNLMVKNAVEFLKLNQLPNGAWPGYSAKIRKGGIFRTCVVLNALTGVGIGLDDASILKALKFTQSKINKIADAKWGGVLIQALCNLTSALLQLELIK